MPSIRDTVVRIANRGNMFIQDPIWSLKAVKGVEKRGATVFRRNTWNVTAEGLGRGPLELVASGGLALGTARQYRPRGPGLK